MSLMALRILMIQKAPMVPVAPTEVPMIMILTIQTPVMIILTLGLFSLMPFTTSRTVYGFSVGLNRLDRRRSKSVNLTPLMGLTLGNSEISLCPVTSISMIVLTSLLQTRRGLYSFSFTSKVWRALQSPTNPRGLSGVHVDFAGVHQESNRSPTGLGLKSCLLNT